MFDRDLLQEQQLPPYPGNSDYAGETEATHIPEAAITDADTGEGSAQTYDADGYLVDAAAITAPDDFPDGTYETTGQSYGEHSNVGSSRSEDGTPASYPGQLGGLIVRTELGEEPEAQTDTEQAESPETQPVAAAADAQFFEANRANTDDAAADTEGQQDAQTDEPAAEPSAAEQSADLAAAAQAETEPAAEEEPQTGEAEPNPAAADQIPVTATEPTVEDEPAAAAASDNGEDNQNAASGNGSAAEEVTDEEPVIPAQRDGGSGGDKPPEDPPTGGEGTGDDEGDEGDDGHEGIPHVPQPPLEEGEVRKFDFDDPEWKTHGKNPDGSSTWSPTPPVQPVPEASAPPAAETPESSSDTGDFDFEQVIAASVDVDVTLDSVVVGRGTRNGSEVALTVMSEGDVSSEIAAGGPTSDSSVVVTMYQPRTEEGAVANIGSMDADPGIGFDVIERAFDAVPSLDEPGTEIKVFGGNERITTEQGVFASHNDVIANYLGTHKRPDDVELVRGLPGGLDVTMNLSGGVVEAYNEFGDSVDISGGSEGGEASGGGDTGGGE